jgi:hypothetical protein
MKFFKLTAAVLAVSGVLLSSAANAQTTIGPGGNATPVPNIGFFGGSIIGSLIAQPFAATNAGQSISGTITSYAYTGGTVAGAFGGSSVDFYYQIVVSSGTQGLQSGSFASFGGFTTAVGEIVGSDPDGANSLVAGSSEATSANRNGLGTGILFDFGTGINVGGTSTVLVVRTNSLSQTAGTVGIVGTAGLGATTNALAPINPAVDVAPEPGSIALLGTVLLGGIAARRRKKA